MIDLSTDSDQLSSSMVYPIGRPLRGNIWSLAASMFHRVGVPRWKFLRKFDRWSTCSASLELNLGQCYIRRQGAWSSVSTNAQHLHLQVCPSCKSFGRKHALALDRPLGDNKDIPYREVPWAIIVEVEESSAPIMESFPPQKGYCVLGSYHVVIGK
jgi:hypothetical protein